MKRDGHKEERSGARVYDPKVILGICAGFAACAAILVLLYPYMVVRFAVVAVALAVAFARRKELMTLWRGMKSAASRKRNERRKA